MVVRVEHIENFTTMHNGCLRNNNLSARAKGLWAYMMSLPDDWVLHTDEINSHFTEGRDAMRKAWTELETEGYVKRRRTRDDTGKIAGMEIVVSETTTNGFSVRGPRPGKPSDGFTGAGESDATKDLLVPSTDSTKSSTANAVVPPRELSSMKDPIANYLQDCFVKVFPDTMWANYAMERKALNDVAKKVRAVAGSLDRDPHDFAKAVMHTFYGMIRHGADDFWQKMPFIPTRLSNRWSDVVFEAERRPAAEQDAEDMERRAAKARAQGARL